MSYTKLLLHCDGTDGSTSFPDSEAGTKKSVTANGNAQVDTAQYKFGGASALFDGTGDYLTVPDSADWDFGSGDFTIDFWVRFSSVNAHSGFFSQYTDALNHLFCYYNYVDGGIYLYDQVGSVYQAKYLWSWSPSISTWYHVALVRNGTSLKFYVDGSALSATVYTAISTNSMGDFTGALNIGLDERNTFYMNGWIDEFRISKGIVRWTADFTPPTNAYASEELPFSETITTSDVTSKNRG